jgi:hypothetical protein
MLAAHEWVNIYDTRCKTLVALFDQRGEPYFIRSDNGPKFVAKAAKRRLEAAGVETLYIEPGSPRGRIPTLRHSLGVLETNY